MSEQKFADLVDKALTDKSFARAMQTNPAQTLESAGYELTPKEKESLRNPRKIPATNSEEAPAVLFIYPNVQPGPLRASERKTETR